MIREAARLPEVASEASFSPLPSGWGPGVCHSLCWLSGVGFQCCRWVPHCSPFPPMVLLPSWVPSTSLLPVENKKPVLWLPFPHFPCVCFFVVLMSSSLLTSFVRGGRRAGGWGLGTGAGRPEVPAGSPQADPGGRGRGAVTSSAGAVPRGHEIMRCRRSPRSRFVGSVGTAGRPSR